MSGRERANEGQLDAGEEAEEAAEDGGLELVEIAPAQHEEEAADAHQGIAPMERGGF